MSEQDWKATLPEDIRSAPALKDVKDVGSLAKRFIDTQAFVGSSLRPPGPDASEDDRAAFREKLKKAVPDLVEIPKDEEGFAKFEGELFERLGRPKEAKDYAPSEGDEVPEAMLEALREQAQSEGLTRKQFQARVKRLAGEYAAAKKADADATKALQKKWGDAYEERAGEARAVAEKLGVPKDVLAAMPPHQLEVWAAAAKAIGGEAPPVAGQGRTGSGKLTPQEHSLRANEIRRRLMTESFTSRVDYQRLQDEMVQHEEAAAKFEVA